FDNALRMTDKDFNDPLSGMLKYDRDHPPSESDKGWMIEIRGSTYQKAGRTFLIETLVHNLTFGIPYATPPFPPLVVRKNLPLVGDAPAAPPPGGTVSAPAATSAPASAAPGAPAPTTDPIEDKISHVFILNVWP